MLHDLEVQPRPKPFTHLLHGFPVVQHTDMQVNEPHIEEDKHQEAILEMFLSSNKEEVLDAKPCEEDEMIVEIAKKTVEFLFDILLSLIIILFEHLLPLLFSDRIKWLLLFMIHDSTFTFNRLVICLKRII